MVGAGSHREDLVHDGCFHEEGYSIMFEDEEIVGWWRGMG